MKYRLIGLITVLSCSAVYGSASAQSTNPPATTSWTQTVVLPIERDCKCSIEGPDVQLVWTGIEAGHGVPIDNGVTDTKTATIKVDVTDHKLCSAGTFTALLEGKKTPIGTKTFEDTELASTVTGLVAGEVVKGAKATL